MKDFLGPSKQLSPADLPTLRSALCFGLYLQDQSVGFEYETKNNIPLNDILKEVATEVCDRYMRANHMFVPPVTISEKGLLKKLHEHWKIASKIARGKSNQKEKKLMEENLDCLLDILKYVIKLTKNVICLIYFAGASVSSCHAKRQTVHLVQPKPTFSVLA